MLYGVIHMCYTVCAAAVFPTCSQQHVVDILAVARLGTCAATAAQQIYSAKTKHINMVIYITMLLPPRVVTTEI